MKKVEIIVFTRSANRGRKEGFRNYLMGPVPSVAVLHKTIPNLSFYGIFSFFLSHHSLVLVREHPHPHTVSTQYIQDKKIKRQAKSEHPLIGTNSIFKNDNLYNFEFELWMNGRRIPSEISSLKLKLHSLRSHSSPSNQPFDP